MYVYMSKVNFSSKFKAAIKAYNQYGEEGGFNVLTGPELVYNFTELYKTYGSQVTGAYRKYEGLDNFGCAYTKSIVDFRANVIAGNGASIQADGEAEQAFIDDLLSRSKLDGEYMTDIARYGELEGKILLLIQNEAGKVTIRHVPWQLKKYEIITDKTDYEKILGVDIDGKRYEPKDFVYIRLGGIRHKVNETPTRLHLILNDLTQIDRALNDWSQYNALYGMGYPYWETETWEQAAEIANQVNVQNWKPGKSMAAPAKHYYVEPSGSGLASIEAEIKTRVKKAAGLSGMPPHFFGFTDLLANRATAEALLEQISAATSAEKNTIGDKLYELTEKCMIKNNAINKTTLDPTKVTATLPMTTQEQLQLLFDVYVPMSNMGFISKQTVREMIPNTDPPTELKRMEEEKENSPDTGKTMKEVINESLI